MTYNDTSATWLHPAKWWASTGNQFSFVCSGARLRSLRQTPCCCSQCLAFTLPYYEITMKSCHQKYVLYSSENTQWGVKFLLNVSVCQHELNRPSKKFAKCYGKEYMYVQKASLISAFQLSAQSGYLVVDISC